MERALDNSAAGTPRTSARRRLAPLLAALAATAAAPRPGAEIVTFDVDRFYSVYDPAGGRPAAVALQRDYIDTGSDALRQFAKIRNLTGTTLAAALGKHPEVYERARRCAAILPAVRGRVVGATRTLGRLYPGARFPPITVLIGRNSTGGTTSAAGVLIGLETICASDWMEPNLENRFVHLIAHEYVHVQQPTAQTDDPDTPLLLTAEVEGGAEFLAELTSGSVSNTQLKAWTRGREAEIETAFVADEDKTDLSKWIYNGHGDAAKPGDLAYWVGYRIVKAFYQHAADKRAAIRDIINVRDAHAFLARSGWRPGMAPG